MSSTELLKKSIKINDISNVKLAIENGANIHYENDDALYYAVINDNIEILKYLIEHGLSFNENDNSYLIKTASIFGSINVIKYMVEHNIDIHYDNDLAVLLAFKYKYYDVFLYLVNHGANIDNCKVYANNKISEMKQYLRNHKINKINEK